jgi:cofilin
MSSGVTVNQQCLETYSDLKLRKKYRYIIYRINDQSTEIIVEKTAERTGDSPAQYEELIQVLPETECRWVVYDFEFEKGDAGKRSKLMFISWVPDSAKIKPKMLAASSRQALRQALQGIAGEIQATDISEVAFEQVLDKANKGA